MGLISWIWVLAASAGITINDIHRTMGNRTLYITETLCRGATRNEGFEFSMYRIWEKKKKPTAPYDRKGRMFSMVVGIGVYEFRTKKWLLQSATRFPIQSSDEVVRIWSGNTSYQEVTPLDEPYASITVKMNQGRSRQGGVLAILPVSGPKAKVGRHAYLKGEWRSRSLLTVESLQEIELDLETATLRDIKIKQTWGENLQFSCRSFLVREQ
jgi:hypothetical protein